MYFPPIPVEEPGVYNVVVLIQFSDEGDSCARCANLPLPEVWRSSARDSMMDMVGQAREMIKECLARDRMIPWIEPPVSPGENESRFLIPIHL